MNNKHIVVAGIFAIILVIISIFWWMLTPTWVDLYPADMSAEEKVAVAASIAKLGIEYKYDEATKTILVKSSDAARVRKSLAESGLPKKSGTGLELFANSDYGLSEFVQNINYQRGMEEELARTIRTLNGIMDARIHLTIKKPSLFDEKKQEPKASVVLTFKSGYVVDKAQVRGIQEMVATSIPGLQPEAVIVLTEAGNVVSSSGDDVSALDASGMEAKYLSIINDLLKGYLGDVKFNASVNIAVDRKKKVTIEENIFPDANTGKGFILKSKQSDKKDSSSDGLSSDSLSTKDDEYIYSKERSEVSYPSGDIAQVSIGIVIQGPINIEEQTILKDLVSKAVGIDSERGDSISLIAAKATVKEQAVDVAVSDDEPVTVLPLNSANPEVHPLAQFLLDYYLLIIAALLGCLVLILALAIRVTMLSRNKTSDLSSYERDKIISELKAWAK